MKITNSSVAMAAVHQEFSYTHKDSASIEVQASKNLPAAILSLSGEAEGKSYMASLQEYQDEQKEKEENISFAGKGSGFLALDKNGDGKINDGSELFGTKSGDGFRDLAEYDEDKNGWIDENDSIFGKLRVWTKDEDGRDYLMDLKQADVGAIYLGNKDTQFSLKDDSNQLNGEIKKTGIYLRESNGTAGTLNHVDLVL